ncbi:MAG: transporter [Verrucomicrobia bacterium]|nr:transporter [Verrucomicrobiota bacterium]
MKEKTSLQLTSTAALLFACALTFSAPALAQNHYPAGVEGIKAGSLPPPGIYLRDYNLVYFADQLKGGPPNFDLLAYVNAPRAIWITDWKILGGYYGMDVLLPFVHTDLTAGGYKDDAFEVGDIHVEPLTLSWHPKQFDFAVGYAFWAPTGDFDANRPVKPGKGFWSNMFTGGATWYPDQEKTWAFSLLNRYELHTENDDLKITPGDTYTLEWGLSKALTKTMELGVVGYYQQQIDDDRGPGVTYDPSLHERIAGVGPEISLVCPKLMLFTSVRYAKEFASKARPEGHTVTVTFTKRW